MNGRDLGQGARLRALTPADLPALVRIADDPRVARNLRDLFPSPYGEADARAWLAFLDSQQPLTHFAITDHGELAGIIGLELKHDIYRRTGEVGYWLGAAYWGRGLATRAVTAMTAWGFDCFELLRIEAEVFAPNRASARVLEKAGYVLEARLRQRITKGGEVMDALMYAALRDDPRAGRAPSTPG